MRLDTARWILLVVLFPLVAIAGCPAQEPNSEGCTDDADCTAPPNECLDANTYQGYEEQGSCNLELGECEYAPLDPVHCSGCPTCDEEVEPLGPGQACGQGLPPCEEGLVCSSWSVCCDELCDAPCRSCVGDHTGGADGVCGFVAEGPEPRSLCDDGLECDVAGACVAPDDPPPAEDLLVVVFASDHDGHLPENTLDGDHADTSRWSAEGGQWIRFDLSREVLLDAARIHFFRGDERQTAISIHCATDGEQWTEVYAGQSSGTTAGFEDYAFAGATAARSVRIDGSGNTDNAWNSLIEVEFLNAGQAVVGHGHVTIVECLEDRHCQLGHQCTDHSCFCVENCGEDPPPDFDILFALDFDDTPTGAYLRTNWSADWGISAGSWSDPCRNQCSNEEEWAGALLSILEEAGNRFMRHELPYKGTAPGTSGTQWWKGLAEHDELYLSYRIRFVGNDWIGTQYDGKLPGFCGGGSCPGGGNPPLNYEGFSTRYMFKNGTQGLFFYLYYAGMDTSSSNYGNSLYFNPYQVNVGEWHTITQRLVMNTPGQANGIVEGFHNGVLVAQKTNMDYRNSIDQKIDVLVFANFLGGSGQEPSTVGHVPTLDFDDFVVFRYADTAEGVPRGLTPWPAERLMVPPAY